MAGTHSIPQPSDATHVSEGGTLKFKWAPNFGSKKTQAFNEAQKFVDSKVLELCDAKVPMQSGALKNSGPQNTVCGSGEVKYVMVYAAYQYYREDLNHYDSNRGAKWFERMKVENKDSIMKGAARIISGGSA